MRPSAAGGAADARRLRRIRGAGTGLLAALGALVAHLVAGGSVEPVPGFVVLAVVLPLGAALTRTDRVAPLRLLGLAATAQAVGHLCLLMAPTGASAGTAGTTSHAGHLAGHHHASGGDWLPSAAMVAGHLAVALLVAGCAAGLDRALIDLLGGVLGRLLPRPVPRLHLPAPVRVTALATPRVRRTAGVRAVAPSRGPPRVVPASATLAPA